MSDGGGELHQAFASSVAGGWYSCLVQRPLFPPSSPILPSYNSVDFSAIDVVLGDLCF